MAKRRFNGDSLTGGTRDVNPQTLNGQVTESAANTFTQATFAVPVMRMGFTANRAQVIEALRLELMISAQDADGTNQQVQLTTATKTALVNLSDNDIVGIYATEVRVNGAAGVMQQNKPFCIDLTDGAGHGLIIATQNVFLAVQGANQTGAAVGSFRLFYRIKNIALPEFIGLNLQQN